MYGDNEIGQIFMFAPDHIYLKKDYPVTIIFDTFIVKIGINNQYHLYREK